MENYIYVLNERVKLSQSGERGFVIGRAEYTNKDNQYLVRYVTADGRQVESWWDEDALRANEDSQVAA